MKLQCHETGPSPFQGPISKQCQAQLISMSLGDQIITT